MDIVLIKQVGLRLFIQNALDAFTGARRVRSHTAQGREARRGALTDGKEAVGLSGRRVQGRNQASKLCKLFREGS